MKRMIIMLTTLLIVCTSPYSDKHQANALVTQTGIAGFYSDKLQGKRTASGEPYDKNRLTAHRSFAFGTMVRVNGKSVVVRINDRSPHRKGWVIDISASAAREIDLQRAGSGSK